MSVRSTVTTGLYLAVFFAAAGFLTALCAGAGRSLVSPADGISRMSALAWLLTPVALAYAGGAMEARSLTFTGVTARFTVAVAAACGLASSAGVVYELAPSLVTSAIGTAVLVGVPAAFTAALKWDVPVLSPFLEDGELTLRQSEVNA